MLLTLFANFLLSSLVIASVNFKWNKSGGIRVICFISASTNIVEFVGIKYHAGKCCVKILNCHNSCQTCRCCQLPVASSRIYTHNAQIDHIRKIIHRKSSSIHIRLTSLLLFSFSVRFEVKLIILTNKNR